jgi:hypothetical protein
MQSQFHCEFLPQEIDPKKMSLTPLNRKPREVLPSQKLMVELPRL